MHGKARVKKKIRATARSATGASQQTLTPKLLHVLNRKLYTEARARLNVMSSSERQDIENFRRELDAADLVPSPGGEGEDASDWVDEVMAGNTAIEISHEGGELTALVEEMGKGLTEGKRRYTDNRNRRDRTYRRVAGFQEQLELMVKAFMLWDSSRGASGLENLQPPSLGSNDEGQAYTIRVVDLFYSRTQTVLLHPDDRLVAPGLIRNGLLPCAPYTPSLAVTIRTMELFRILRLRCPRLAVQPFVRGLCDVHSTPYRNHLSEMFSVSFDLYSSLLRSVEARVLASLERNSPDWRMKNACPACTHVLKDEPNLRFNIQVTMDGGDSAKRIARRVGVNLNGLDPDELSERLDLRNGGQDYFIPREQVDRWSKEALGAALVSEPSHEGTEANPCDDRWKNMKHDMSSAAWGIFEETGIFICVCRHGFFLTCADMVRSGELAKYGLAVVEKLLAVFGSGVCAGYDVGCKFRGTVSRTPLGPEADSKQFSCYPGLFHGHAHNRQCQLNNLGLYTSGMGLEDLERCEKVFSKVNAVAPGFRYASRFHRHQTLSAYFQHLDRNDNYQNLSSTLLSKYKNALKVLSTAPALAKTMEDLGVPDGSVFEEWLAREKDYLKQLKAEPEEETLQMEYIQKLVKFYAAQEKVAEMKKTLLFVNATGQNCSQEAPRGLETVRRHTLELRDNLLASVQELEVKLNIAVRWRPGSFEWQDAMALVLNRRYQRALDHLEGLVVSRLFELTKMNMSGTGYKMRTHMGKAFKARSQAIRSALNAYNAAAEPLKRPILQWEQVVEYAFLSEFDLLRSGKQEIWAETWATPAGREAMDAYYKVQRAQEEIQRLNVEIRRFVSYMHHEERELVKKEKELSIHEPLLAYQVGKYRGQRSRYDSQHWDRLTRLSKVVGFSGTLQPGTRLQGGPGRDSEGEDIVSNPHGGGTFGEGESEGSESEEEEEEEEITDLMVRVLTVADDNVVQEPL